MKAERNNKKTIWAWTMYDWANSVFSLTIATAIFPPYYESITKAAAIAGGNNPDGPYYVNIFGFQVVSSALYSYALSAGFLLVTLFSPILSGIADARGNKKFFMKIFCYLGSASCMLMYFFTPQNISLGVGLFILSLFGFGGSIVFYNAFLPEIVTEDQFDRVSARGFSMGYLGSVILLVINLVTILMPDLFFPVQQMADGLIAAGTDATQAMSDAKDHYVGVASRLSFVSVGIWWAGFAQIPFAILTENPRDADSETNMLSKGWHELKKVLKEIQQPHNHLIKRYLWGFFFVSMGVQTVMYVASLFGAEELHLPTQDLIITVLIIQIIAVLGAWAFSRISERIGNIYSLMIMIVVWTIICVLAYFIQTDVQFYMLGALVGMVMGGIQAILRSTYAKLIPDDSPDHASYFSFYDVTEKISVVLGTFSYGFLLTLTGNMRSSAVALVIYFAFGMFFISRIKNFKSFHP
ncbi:MAG: MFS transporter [Bacteroidota bacterium]